MTKNSAEGCISISFRYLSAHFFAEKIMQAGKKKLVLDHLIVQKMDDAEDAENIQSMLTFGAAALFDENQESHDIKCAYSGTIMLRGVYSIFARHRPRDR